MSYQTLTIEVPNEVYEQIANVSELSSLSPDDLITAACEMVYKEPTQSVMKRVIRRAQAYKVSRILQNFPKTRKEGEETPE